MICFGIVFDLHACEQLKCETFFHQSINFLNVTIMISMFSGCTNLTNITALSNWNTSNVTAMEDMFWNCTNLTTLDMSGWDTSKVNDVDNFLTNCSKLEN